ncbi:MAG: hypothetical protein HQM13_14130 [SAR324 cluster bacterium]|nr:hypothetical protein [SAR324 cluster bacterium]
MANKLQVLVITAMTCLGLMACASGEADIDFSFDPDTANLNYDDLEACTSAISAEDGDTYANCGATLSATFTAKEKGGQCNATGVKVSWTYTYPDGSTEEITVKFGDIGKGDSKTENVSIHFKNVAELGNIQAEGDADFSSDCGGSTGLGI